MTDKKLTDNEIIKALKCCANGKCGECPLFKEDCGDDIICKNALDFITRQQAEIERLKALAENGASAIDTNNRLVQKFAEIKSEAVKEFAERLKHSFFDNGYESPDVDFDYFVDNLVKELMGENND